MRGIKPSEFEEFLMDALEEAASNRADDGEAEFMACRIMTYEQVGMLTRDKGLVVNIGKSEFQVTIVPVSGPGEEDEEEEDEEEEDEEEEDEDLDEALDDLADTDGDNKEGGV